MIAGGQTLVPMMAMRLARPTRLIDINRIAALAYIRERRRRHRHRRQHAPSVVERDPLIVHKRCRCWRKRHSSSAMPRRATAAPSAASSPMPIRRRNCPGRHDARRAMRATAAAGETRDAGANFFTGADGDGSAGRRMPRRQCAFRCGASGAASASRKSMRGTAISRSCRRRRRSSSGRRRQLHDASPSASAARDRLPLALAARRSAPRRHALERTTITRCRARRAAPNRAAVPTCTPAPNTAAASRASLAARARRRRTEARRSGTKVHAH